MKQILVIAALLAISYVAQAEDPIKRTSATTAEISSPDDDEPATPVSSLSVMTNRGGLNQTITTDFRNGVKMNTLDTSAGKAHPELMNQSGIGDDTNFSR